MFRLAARFLSFSLLLAMPAALDAAICGGSGAACSTSSTCTDGCWAVCGSGGCASGCAENQIAGAAVNVTLKGVPASEVAQRVSQQSGVRFAFIPSDPRDPMTVELKGVSAQELVKVFGAFGGAGLARPRETKQGGQQVAVTLRARNISTGDLAQLLADLAGEQLSFRPADPSEKVSLDIKDLSARDLKKALVGYGNVENSSSSSK